MNSEDTICALSTSPGQGAIAVIRISGASAISVADDIFYQKGRKGILKNKEAGTIHYGRIKFNNEELDDVILSLFRAPRSYTGEDTIEISCHGSIYIQQRILEILIENGARLAKPGEYTLRAFLNGKLDLSQAEGVADLIASGSAAAHRLAMNQIRGGFSEEIKKLRDELLNFISLIELELDFSEEDVEFANRDQLNDLINKVGNLLKGLISSFEYGNVIKNGIPVAIIGPANSGKSTLLNRLLKEERAIVSEFAGTTRDFIEDTIILDGIQFRFIDTAGLRKTNDFIEIEGIQRSMKKYSQASVVIVLIDPTEKIEEIQESLSYIGEGDINDINKNIILILNKVDLLTSKEVKIKMNLYSDSWKGVKNQLAISAKDGTGISDLEAVLIAEARKRYKSEQNVVVTNARHFEALKHADDALERAKEGISYNVPTDLLAQDIREVLHYLGEITGEITTDEILGNIFKNFCIGK